MTHQVTLLKARPQRSGDFVVKTTERSVRTKLLDWLLGKEQKVTIIVPGDSVSQLAIREVEEPHESYEAAV